MFTHDVLMINENNNRKMIYSDRSTKQIAEDAGVDDEVGMFDFLF